MGFAASCSLKCSACTLACEQVHGLAQVFRVLLSVIFRRRSQQSQEGRDMHVHLLALAASAIDERCGPPFVALVPAVSQCSCASSVLRRKRSMSACLVQAGRELGP